MTEVRSGCIKKPNENLNSSLLASVSTSPPSLDIEGARDGCWRGAAGAAMGFVGCSRVFERFVDLRGARGARMLTEMRLSSSARSASRSTMMAGAWIRPLGILMGAGGPRLIDSDRGGVLSRDKSYRELLSVMVSVEAMGVMSIISPIDGSPKPGSDIKALLGERSQYERSCELEC